MSSDQGSSTVKESELSTPRVVVPECAVFPPPPNGYRVSLPPGWVQIPLRVGTEEAMAVVLDRSLSGIPRDRAGIFRDQLHQRLSQQVSAAQESNGLDLYLPIAIVHGMALAASVLVAVVSYAERLPDRSCTLDDLRVLLGQDGGRSELVEIGDVVAVRVDGVTRGGRHGSPTRWVDYVMASPREPGQWLTASFSTAGDNNPEGEFADMFVEIFDSMMATFCWV